MLNIENNILTTDKGLFVEDNEVVSYQKIQKTQLKLTEKVYLETEKLKEDLYM